MPSKRSDIDVGSANRAIDPGANGLSDDLLRVWTFLSEGRLIIFVVCCVAVLAAAGYSLLTPNWYRADVLMMPADTKTAQGGLSGQLSGLGGLASLAGVTLGEGSTAEPIAVLKSHAFTRSFIEDYGLLPVLFAEDWDVSKGRWKANEMKDRPDMYDAVRLFEHEIRSVSEDKRTKLVTLSVEWKDARLASEWANALIKRLNERTRQRQLREAESSLAYLKKELAATDVVPLQQSVGRIIEIELQKGMLARVNEEAAFRVVDPAEVAKWPSRPRRFQIMALAAVIGIILGSLVVLFRASLRAARLRTS